MSAEERALSRTLLVDLEYVYEAQGDDDISGVVDYGVSWREPHRFSSGRSSDFWRRRR
jgi:hypothetical protein